MEMNLEFLANELILDIFEYIHGIELLRIFHNLNNRLDELLVLHFQTHPLNFRSISKQNFDYICQKILPLLTHQVTSVYLSNDDDTPDQPNLFLSHAFQFTNLQSLSLSHIRSTDLINRIILNCPDLISIHIDTCNFDNDSLETEICMNSIWNLPKLKYCHLDIYSLTNSIAPLPRTISSSLEILSIENTIFSFDRFISLLQCTPNLRDLNIRVQDISLHEESTVLNVLPLLTKLKIYFQGSFDILKDLLRSMSNLSELIIVVQNIRINGYQWADIFDNYLHKLKIFKLLMFFRIDYEKNIVEETDQLIESFQTKFWLDERQWYIQCNYPLETEVTYLYTLPFGFQNFECSPSNMLKTTCPTDRKFLSLNHVNTLIVDNELMNFASQFTFQFPNVRHLELFYPFNDSFWLIIPKFDRLITLEIISVVHSNENDRSVDGIRLLLNRAVHLHSLTIDYLIISQLSIEQIRNPSIRRLDLMAIDGHFYGSECISLIHLLFGIQCEVLLINIEQRTIVLDLIENLPNLRALTFQCQDDNWGDSEESLLMEDELLKWLKHHLPSTCSIIRDEKEISAIRLWIR